MQNLSSDDNCDNELRQRIANNETKILAFELRSMHKGGRKKFSKKEMSKLLEKSRDIKSLKKIYKVFIEYYPLADLEKEYLNYYSLIESKFFIYPFNKQSKNWLSKNIIDFFRLLLNMHNRKKNNRLLHSYCDSN